MKTKPLILPLAVILLLAVVAAVSSVNISMFFYETSGSTITINDGDSVGLIVSADSILEDSMDITVDLVNSSGVITTLLDVTVASDSYDTGSNPVRVGKSSYLGPGTYTIRGTVVGASGQTNSKTLNLVVMPQSTTNHLPTITSTPVTKINEQSTYGYDVNANDVDGDALTYTLTQAPTWLTINSQSGVISGMSPSVTSTTQYSVTVTVSDGKGSVTQFYTIDVADVGGPGQNRLPVITSNPVTSVVEGQSYTYDVDASDADGDSLVYSLQNPAPNWLSINAQTGVISGTAPNVTQNTQYSVVVIVSDGKGSSNQSYTITVQDTGTGATNHPPIISTNPVTSVNENSAYLYDVDASDADNDPLSFSMTGPTWLTINSQTGVISGTAPSVTANTPFSIVVRVTDGKAIVTQNYTLTVVDSSSGGNQLPTITTSPVTQVNENTAYAYDVNATDADGDTLVYSLTTAPTWLSINAQTGLITGTAPMVIADTTYNVVVTVSDGKGTATQSYAIIVKNIATGGQNNVPVITTSPVTQVNENSNYSYDVNANDADGDTLVYSLTTAPSWLTINSQTGLISGTSPGVSQDTTFAVTVVVSDGKGGNANQSYAIIVKDTSSSGGGSSSKGKGSSVGTIGQVPLDDFYNMQYLNGLNAQPPVVLMEDDSSDVVTKVKNLGFWGSALFWMFVLVVIVAIAVLIVWLRNA